MVGGNVSPAASAVGFIAGCLIRLARRRTRCVSPAASAVGFIAGRRRVRCGLILGGSLRRLRPSASLRAPARRSRQDRREHSPAASAVGFIAGFPPRQGLPVGYTLRRLRPSASLRADRRACGSRGDRLLSGGFGRRLHCGWASAGRFNISPSALRRLRPSASLRGRGSPRRCAAASSTLRRLRPSASLRAHSQPFPAVGRPALSGGFGRRLHCGERRTAKALDSGRFSPAASAVGFIAGVSRARARGIS